MVAHTDDPVRRHSEPEELLASIEAHVEGALAAPGNGAVPTHLEAIRDAARKLRERLFPESVVPAAAADARPHERVLLVEDDPQVRQLLTRTLTRLGYAVVVAENGREALDALEDGGPVPDILVTDVLMPKLGGRELAVRLRLRDPNLKVLFVSGYSHGALDARFLRRPGTSFLAKPFTARELDRALTALRSCETAQRA